MPQKRLNRFGGKKERCRPLREPKFDSSRSVQPHTRHLFKKNPSPSPLPPSLTLSFPDVCLTKFEPPRRSRA